MDAPPGAETRTIRIGGRKATELLLPELTVVVESGADRNLSRSFSSGVVEIGTHPDNDLVLRDPTVSRRHAVLRTSVDGIVVEDLGSKNGTWVHAVRVDVARVGSSGLVQVGETVLNVTAGTARLVAYPEDTERFHGMAGGAEASRQLFALVDQLAKVDVPVTIQGQTGTGKELIARALHAAGPRRDHPFHVLDCGSLVKDLLSSELFGHEKGAFTGADQARPGLFELACGGTVFLDEIGEMDLSLQPHLLRVLETREVKRLGARQPVPVSFRLVSATNRDLKAMVRSGRFRPDLLYRLAGVTIRVPSLSDRPEDIPVLVDAFLTDQAAGTGGSLRELTPEARRVLADHHWPGNIRELRHVIDTLLALFPAGPITAGQVLSLLDGAAPAASPAQRPGRRAEPVQLPGSGAPAELMRSRRIEAELDAIRQALVACGGNRKLAAQRLGISRSSLYNKLRRAGLVGDGDPEG